MVMGVDIKASMVPLSHSLATIKAVKSVPIRVRMIAAISQ